MENELNKKEQINLDDYTLHETESEEPGKIWVSIYRDGKESKKILDLEHQKDSSYLTGFIENKEKAVLRDVFISGKGQVECKKEFVLWFVDHAIDEHQISIFSGNINDPQMLDIFDEIFGVGKVNYRGNGKPEMTREEAEKYMKKHFTVLATWKRETNGSTK